MDTFSFSVANFSVLEIVDGVSQKKFGVVIFKFGKEWISLIPFPILRQRYNKKLRMRAE